MKLIKRTTLQYSEGSSDKVYEVDICQIPEGSYVVNFRYGKRGANLKEGTKTTQPVNLPEAQRAFDKLIQEKTKKGYQDVTSPSIEIETPPVETPVDKTARKQAVLNRLASNQPSKWKLERAIWRAGELKISEATPLLIKLIGTGEPLRDYCIAWSLGYCGGEDALSALVRLYQNATSPEFVSRIAFEALLKLADAATKAELQAEMVEFLPKELQKLAPTEKEQFAIALKSYLEGGDYRRFAVLDTIYRVDNQYIRPALLEILRTAPLKPSYFKYVRHIFKVAEYRHDAEVFAILAYRFEKESGNFEGYSYREWDAVNRRYTDKIKRRYEDELKSPNSNKAYSNQTREYLRNRTWRTIKQLGKEGDSNYIDMAVEMLLQYSDTNAEAPRNTVLHRWNSPNMHRSWDAYASCINLNHILYENSPRYELKHNSKAWCCREGYKPGDATPEKREEAFPELWNQHPEALLRLLLESECLPVHEFAVKAIKASQVFCASINIDIIIKLLEKAYEITAQFGFELAQPKYNPQNPNRELVLAVIRCVSQSARNQGYQWIEAKPEYFLEDSSFIFALLTSQHEDTRSFGRRLLSFSILSDAAAKVILGRIITELLAFTAENNSEIVKEISKIVILRFAP